MSNISTIGFNGEYLDDTLDNYHLGNGYRAYNPTTMQFTAPDDMSPFGRGGINPYMYVRGDPINNSDPSGHFNLSNIINIYNKVSPIQLPTALTASAIAVAVVTTAVFVLLDMATDGLGQALKPEFNAIKDISEEATKMSPLRRFLSGAPYKLSGGPQDAAMAGDHLANQVEEFREAPPPDPVQHNAQGPARIVPRPNKSVDTSITEAVNSVRNSNDPLQRWTTVNTVTGEQREMLFFTHQNRVDITDGTPNQINNFITPKRGFRNEGRLSKVATPWETKWKPQYKPKGDLWSPRQPQQVSNMVVFSLPYPNELFKPQV